MIRPSKVRPSRGGLFLLVGEGKETAKLKALFDCNEIKAECSLERGDYLRRLSRIAP